MIPSYLMDQMAAQDPILERRLRTSLPSTIRPLLREHVAKCHRTLTMSCYAEETKDKARATLPIAESILRALGPDWKEEIVREVMER